MWPLLVVLYSITEFSLDMYRGLGASNGRWVSFLQSVESVYSYRIQKPFCPPNESLSPRTKIRKRRGSVYYAGSVKNEISQKLYLGFVCGWLKFGAGTFVSLTLGVEPVLAKSWRHFASFGVALMCVQLTPKDMFFRHLSERSTRGLLLRLCMFAACALYKLKKMTFVVYTTRALGYGWLMAVVLCVVECEGSGVFRRAENHAMHISMWRSLDSVRDVLWSSVAGLVERTNFWLSIVVAMTLTVGAHHVSILEGPMVYTLPWTIHAAALCILLARYCRTTVMQLWSDFVRLGQRLDKEEVRVQTSLDDSFALTSTPAHNISKKKKKKKRSTKKVAGASGVRQRKKSLSVEPVVPVVRRVRSSDEYLRR